MKTGKYDWLIAMLISVPVGMLTYERTGSVGAEVLAVFATTFAVRICLAINRYQWENQ
jgi:hypothetical protein